MHFGLKTALTGSSSELPIIVDGCQRRDDLLLNTRKGRDHCGKAALAGLNAISSTAAKLCSRRGT